MAAQSQQSIHETKQASNSTLSKPIEVVYDRMDKATPLWDTLLGKTIHADTVVLNYQQQIEPLRPRPVFDTCTTLIMNECNKNFVYYWLHSDSFPKLKEIYLNSHACQGDVFRRFQPGTVKWFIDRRHLSNIHSSWYDQHDIVWCVFPREPEFGLSDCSLRPHNVVYEPAKETVKETAAKEAT